MEYILGDIIMPAVIGLEAELYNVQTLTELLNSGDCFDTVMTFGEHDVLTLHFNCKESYLAYSFAYLHSKWEVQEFEPFGNGLKELKGGRITSPFTSM